MADTALEVYSVERAKRNLRIPDSLTEHDGLIGDLIAASVSFIEEETGRPLIDRSNTYQLAVPQADRPLFAPLMDVLNVSRLRYWSTDGALRSDPDGSISGSNLGRIASTFRGLMVYPPADGWPEVLSGSRVHLTVTQGLNLPDWPDTPGSVQDEAAVHPFHALREAVLPVVRQLYDGGATILPNAILQRFGRPKYAFGRLPTLLASTTVSETPIDPSEPVTPTTRVQLYVAWSDDADFSPAEVTAGTLGQSGELVTIPARSANGYIGIFIPVSAGSPDQVHLDGNQHNQRPNYTADGDLTQVTVNGVSHNAFITLAEQNAAILGTGTRTLQIDF